MKYHFNYHKADRLHGCLDIKRKEFATTLALYSNSHGCPWDDHKSTPLLETIGRLFASRSKAMATRLYVTLGVDKRPLFRTIPASWNKMQAKALVRSRCRMVDHGVDMAEANIGIKPNSNAMEFVENPRI